MYNDPKAYTALMDEVGKTLAACKGNIKFFWDNKDQLLNGARTGEIVGAMMWDTGGWKLNFTGSKGADQLMDAKLKAQFAKSFPEAALKNVKWYPAVPPSIEDIEGKVLDRVKAAK